LQALLKEFVEKRLAGRTSTESIFRNESGSAF